VYTYAFVASPSLAIHSFLFQLDSEGSGVRPNAKEELERECLRTQWRRLKSALGLASCQNVQTAADGTTTLTDTNLLHADVARIERRLADCLAAPQAPQTARLPQAGG